MKAIDAVVEAETEAVEAVAAANPFPADIYKITGMDHACDFFFTLIDRIFA